MLRPLHLRRSWLFVGATNEADIDASFESEADVCILDFEDFCLPENRPKGRKMLKEILEAWNKLGKVSAVRINPLETEDGRKDLKAALCQNLNIILLPKVINKRQVDYYLKEKKKYALKKNLKYNNIEFVPNIETALGIENLNTILISKSINGAVVASEDMALSLGLQNLVHNQMLDFVRKRFHLSCKAHNKLSIDMPYTGGNMLELKNEIKHIKSLGMSAKSAIYANHCSIINKLLTPTKAEFLNALKIIENFKKAIEKKNTQVYYKNRYLELPAFNNAKNIIKRYESFLEFEKL